MFKKLKDPVSSVTHMFGAIAAIPCTILLVCLSSSSLINALSFLVFGMTMFLLYFASALYHGASANEKTTKILRKIDHMMIFVLIAGTYTPICLIPLKGTVGYALLIAIWAVAFLGIIMTSFWIAPRWLSSGIYVLMGWMVVFAFYPLIKAIPLSAVVFLIAGGITYTVGAVIYALKKPPLPFKHFGFHEIFHIFVLGGSAFHVIFMFKYII